MMTVRQIERLWTGRSFNRLVTELYKGRPESAPRLKKELDSEPAALAMALIRLDELSQAHVPLYRRLLNRLITLQHPDGGWLDPATTALCAKALSLQNGGGVALGNAFRYLAELQKDVGIWPSHPIRRMDADPLVSAFILYHLADHPDFRETVRIDDAINWFEKNAAKADEETATLWRRGSARRRPRFFNSSSAHPEFAWS